MTTSKGKKLARENTVESLLVVEEEAKGLTAREKMTSEGRHDAGKLVERDDVPARPASACCSRETPQDARVTQRPKSALDAYDRRHLANDTVCTLTSPASSATPKRISSTTNTLLQTALRSFDLLSRDDDADMTGDLRSTLRDLLNMQHRIMTRVGRLELCNGFG